MKLGIIRPMRIFAILTILPLVAFGKTRTMPVLPPPVFADTEVSACHQLNQSGEAVNRLDFHLDFNGTPSNNVEVAFGTDANGDRSLSLDETDVVIGWECGRYFIERYRTGDRFDEASVGTNGVARSLDWHYLVKNERRTVKCFAATNETGAVFANLSASAPDWIYNGNWNLMRLTARGVDVQDEQFEVSVRNAVFVINLR